jgi:hypothetical protein
MMTNRENFMKTILISLLLLFPLTAIAQPPTLQLEDIKANVRTLLASEQVRDQAWAAYYIGKFRWTEFTPELVKMLARGDDGSFLHRATFDALIQLNTVVKAEKLLPHFERFPNQVLILLAVDPTGNEQAFLSLLEKERSEETWLALCNLLVRLRSKGLAPHLLRQLKIKPTVSVTDKNLAVGGGGYNGGCGDGWLTVPSGYPPLVNYRLTQIEKTGAVVFVTGPHTIYYERSERHVEGDTIGVGGCFHFRHRDGYRVEYLAALLNLKADQLNFSVSPSFTIVWKGLLPYQREIRRIRAEVKQSYNHLLEKLIAAELLASSEASDLAPQIELQINDIRKDKSVALPKL